MSSNRPASGRAKRLVVALATLLVACLAAPRTARADGEAPAGAFVVLVATPVVLPAAAIGVVSDVAIGAHLASSGRVPRSWAVTGTIVWGIDTTVTTAALVAVHVAGASAHYRGNDWDAAFGTVYGAWGTSAASLALSIYGLTRPKQPASSSATTDAGISWSVPMVVPSRSGATLVVGGTF